MTEEKLVHQSTATRSLLWGVLWGALATAAVGLLVLRPVRFVVSDQYPPLPSAERSPGEQSAGDQSAGDQNSGLQGVEDQRPSAQDPGATQGPAAPQLPPPETAAPPEVSAAPSPLDPAAGTATPAPNPPSAAIAAGGLRVSNQTGHPVRVALLPQLAEAAEVPVSGETAFKEPVHWDFAPQEGSLNGLRLSLPDGKQTIQSGDVLVVFAQDGTQRYWGPYVVGATALPAWQPETSEWQLTIQSSAAGAGL